MHVCERDKSFSRSFLNSFRRISIDGEGERGIFFPSEWREGD